MTTPTIHNNAKLGEIASTVIMPGDPLRATYIAEKYLENAVQYSNVRGIPVYTGDYKGKKVSVMASGMGTGSMGIYSYELYNDYQVDRIIRVGTAGGLSDTLNLKDLVFCLSSSTDIGFANQFGLKGNFNPCCSFEMARRAANIATKLNFPYKAGMFFCGSAFHYSLDFLREWANVGCIAVEMESSALYMNAQAAHKEALAICTVTDQMFTNESCTTEQRQTTLDQMITLALELAHTY